MIELVSSYLNKITPPSPDNKRIVVRDQVAFAGKNIVLFDQRFRAYVYVRRSNEGKTLSTMLSFNTYKGRDKEKYQKHPTVIEKTCHSECVQIYCMAKNVDSKLPRSPVCKFILEEKKELKRLRAK